MKQEPKAKSAGAAGAPKALTRGGGALPASLAELRAVRVAQRATNERVEELKLRLFRMTEQHMDQAVSLIRRWLKDKE